MRGMTIKSSVSPPAIKVSNNASRIIPIPASANMYPSTQGIRQQVLLVFGRHHGTRHPLPLGPLALAELQGGHKAVAVNTPVAFDEQPRVVVDALLAQHPGELMTRESAVSNRGNHLGEL